MRFKRLPRESTAGAYALRLAMLLALILHANFSHAQGIINTVAGRTSPFESKSCVMPTFLPRIPVTLAISFSVPSLARRSSNDGYWLGLFNLFFSTHAAFPDG